MCPSGVVVVWDDCDSLTGKILIVLVQTIACAHRVRRGSPVERIANLVAVFFALYYENILRPHKFVQVIENPPYIAQPLDPVPPLVSLLMERSLALLAETTLSPDGAMER